mmetsp:Transcript_19294/g.45149  ORF Transcript_19294/g.45149 Transcript_19294/m.45149 type:complete len:96 (+) Transcript_19294:1412-1699(+)
MIWSCCGVQLSMATERTKEMWTPSDLCLPLQSRQMSVPMETLAQSGFGVGQSAHTLFPGMEVIMARSLGDICILPVLSVDEIYYSVLTRTLSHLQ